MKINNKIIDANSAVYIIAEIGINHNGNIVHALQMVREASEAGCDAIKLQVIDAELSYNKDTLSYEIFKDATLSLNEIKEIKKLCHKLDLDFLSTVGDSNSLALMEEVGIDGYKISSGLMTNYPLIEKILSIGKPVIFSTGMSLESEIKELISFIDEFKFDNYAILHCVSEYPSPSDVINIKYINSLEKLTNKVVGYSDHYLGETAVLSAVTLGAKIIEKHFSFDNTLTGADHKISANFKEMKSMVTKLREIEKMIIGSDVKVLCDFENKNKNKFRRKLIINKNLKEGAKITLSDLDARRFNDIELGTSPKKYKQFIGKILKINLEKHSLISLKDIYE